MRTISFIVLSFFISALNISPASAEETAAKPADTVVMLSADWGTKACAAWNADEVLSKGLKDSGWISSHKNNRGFRIIELYRSDCASSPHIQLKFQEKDGKAVCVDSGAMFDKDWDFLMYATTADWVSMGKGEVGPMGGMMSGKLSFKGSMWEAMQNMGPFKNFLLLFGKIPTATDKCN